MFKKRNKDFDNIFERYYDQTQIDKEGIIGEIKESRTSWCFQCRYEQNFKREIDSPEQVCNDFYKKLKMLQIGKECENKCGLFFEEGNLTVLEFDHLDPSAKLAGVCDYKFWATKKRRYQRHAR